MIFTTAICLVLALSSSLANQATVDQDINNIVSKVVVDAIGVIKDGKNANLSVEELHNNLLETIRRSIESRVSEIIELGKLSGGTTDIAQTLSQKIYQNKDLKSALQSVSNGKKAPRFIGAAILGITQIVTDVVNMGLRRY